MARHLHALPPLPPPDELPSPRLPPPEQLAGILRHYRRAGVTFDVAWERAVGARPADGLITWPSSRRDASEWWHAVMATREGWRASYERWPPEMREIAVGELGRILSDELRRAAEAGELAAAAGL